MQPIEIDSRFSQLLVVLQSKKLNPQHLLEQGFDSWQLVQQLSPQILQQLGYEQIQIKEIIESIYKCSNFEDIKLQISQHKQQKEQYQLQKKNVLTVRMILRGCFCKFESKMSLSKKYQMIKMIVCQQKQIRYIRNLQNCKKLQILNLSGNFIQKIQGLQSCPFIKNLKLDRNCISTVQGIFHLKNLQILNLSKNKISKFEGFYQYFRIRQLYLNNQAIKQPFVFDPQSLKYLPYCNVLQCNYNSVISLQGFQSMRYLTNLSIKGCKIQSVAQISQIIGQLKMLEYMDCRQSPIIKTKKYRDYIVILCQRLQQLDGKKILPSQRKFLIGLFQAKNKKQQVKKVNQKNIQLVGNKMQNDESASPSINIRSPKSIDCRQVHQITKKYNEIKQY